MRGPFLSSSIGDAMQITADSRELTADKVRCTPWKTVRPGYFRRKVYIDGEEFDETNIRCQYCGGKSYECVTSYMVKDSLWESSGEEGIVCLSCFEESIGRPVTIEDLKDVPINEPFFRGYQMQTNEGP